MYKLGATGGRDVLHERPKAATSRAVPCINGPMNINRVMPTEVDQRASGLASADEQRKPREKNTAYPIRDQQRMHYEGVAGGVPRAQAACIVEESTRRTGCKIPCPVVQGGMQRCQEPDGRGRSRSHESRCDPG